MIVRTVDRVPRQVVEYIRWGEEIWTIEEKLEVPPALEGFKNSHCPS